MSDSLPPDALPRFDALTLPYVDRIYRAAYHLTHRADDAEDLTQETYLRAYQGFDKFQGRHPKAWLFAIMRNAYIDSYRQRLRRPALVDIESTVLDVLDSRELEGTYTLSAEDLLLAGGLDEEVDRALMTLPADWRLIILLADLEELTYQEIAEVTQVPIGTVMSHLHRSRRRLYQQLHSFAHAAGYVTENTR